MRLKLPVLRSLSPLGALAKPGTGRYPAKWGGVGGPTANRNLLVRGPIFLIVLAFFLSFSSAGTHASLYDDWQRLRQREKELGAKIGQLRAEENNLKNQISFLSYQIELTEVEIEAAEMEIKLLSEDIGDLSQRLERIASFLEFQEKTFVARARSAYIADHLSPFEIVLGSEGLDEAIRQIKYLKVLEAQDREVLEQLRDTRADYNEQKTLLEEKKAGVEELKKTVEAKKASLEGQKASKTWLLSVTLSEERKYQQLLAQVREEIEAINRALSQRGISLGRVYAGKSKIGEQGNTGCSTGPHLHFELRINGVPRDPLPYLLNGQLDWPALVSNVRCNGRNAPCIWQYFGENKAWYCTLFGRWFPSCVYGHSGIDMEALPSYGAPILAAGTGMAEGYSGSSCWGNPPLQYVKITHDNGWVTFYFHLRHFQ